MAGDKQLTLVEPDRDRTEPDTWKPWGDPDEIVIEDQPRTCMYFNKFGQLVIRQEAPYPEEDPILLFNPEYLPKLIRALAAQLPPGQMLAVKKALGEE